ncbi:MAG: Ketol-acid reductoisomerase, partial [Parcubacteria group bacterium GW2011_GWA2_36_10]
MLIIFLIAMVDTETKGKFAREWIKENELGRPNFNRLLKEGDEHPIEKVGQQLREMMPWMKK